MQTKLASWASKDFDARRALCQVLLAQIKCLRGESWNPFTKDGTDFRRLRSDFLHYTGEIEVYKGVSEVGLIDELEHTVLPFGERVLRKTWRNKGVRVGKGTSFLSGKMSGNGCGKRGMGSLSLAIAENLRLHVARKLSSDPCLVRNSCQQRLLLDVALRPHRVPRDCVQGQRVDPEMIKLLLKHGASPNEGSCPGSCSRSHMDHGLGPFLTGPITRKRRPTSQRLQTM